MTEVKAIKKAVDTLFLLNEWYIAARSNEVKDRPFARTICNIPLVLFRTSDGGVSVLEDRCPHRKAPLSTGEMIGDEIQCGYHGARFTSTGRCTIIPSQQDLPVPSGFKAKAFIAKEIYDLIFVWLGDPAKADEAKIPDWSRNTRPGWAAVHGYHHLLANYELLNDNLLDLSHSTYVHKTTLAGPGTDETPMYVNVEDDVVKTGRVIPNVDPVPLHRITFGITGKVDRWTLTDFFAPCYLLVTLGVEPVGSTDKLETPLFVVMNSAVPETETTTHYFWSTSRCRNIEDEALTAKFYDLVKFAFDEDSAMIEAQQKMLSSDRSDTRLAAFRGDAGGVAARRIIARRLKAERAERAA